MKTLINIETGILNEFRNFYPEVEIDEALAANEIFELSNLFKDEGYKMEDSESNWIGKFDHHGKQYAIMGDDSLTSSGRYVMGELVD